MAKYTYVMNSQDTETKEWASRLAQNGWSAVPLVGGSKQLGRLTPTDTLGVMAHGTAELAVTVKQGVKKRWTATELATQLSDDGLGKSHRVIELLVCEAASSVNTVQGAAEMDALRQKYLATEDPNVKKTIEAQFKAKYDASPTLTDMSQWSTKYLLPFGAAFIQEMKTLLYNSIRVYCYKYCVSAHFTGGRVWLQDPATGDRTATDADKVQWL